MICRLLRLSAPGSAQRLAKRGRSCEKASARQRKGQWNSEDAFIATLQKKLQENGQVVLQLHAATDPGGGIRHIRQGNTSELDRTEVQEGVREHHPDPESCHAG